MTGIRNVSGVSCHISCALQLIAHGVPPLSRLLSELVPILNDNEILLQHLGLVLGEVASMQPHGEINTVLDPTQLYSVLEKRTCLDPHDVGDVSTAVYRLFQVLGKLSPQWKHAVDYLVGLGTTQQLLYGIHGKILRIKRGKVKAMACPFPLPRVDSNQSSVVPKLATIWDHLVNPSPSTGVPVQDYDWESLSLESYTEEILEGNGDDDTWKTTRCVHILNVPRFFFCSIERFAYTPDGQRVLQLPEIDLSSTMPMMGREYRLKGGVLHVSEESIDDEGHYVAVIPIGGDDTESWMLIDDDRSNAIDKETALAYLRGTETDNGVHYCAVLVLYGPDNKSDDYVWEEVASGLHKCYQSIHADWSKPESLVGRKLKISWAKGRFYSGIVADYDGATGKHRVLYDDGDVREYDLQTKTVEWLS